MAARGPHRRQASQVNSTSRSTGAGVFPGPFCFTAAGSDGHRLQGAATRREFKKAASLRTVVICCYDPRAAGIPDAVAKALPHEIYPGQVIKDANIMGDHIPGTR